MHTNKAIHMYRSKKVLLLLATIFLMPFIIAYILIINKDIIPFNTVQTGDLIEPPFKLKFYSLHNLANKWHVVYLSDETCYDNSCIAKKQLLNNLHSALGKEKYRVQVHTTPSTQITPINPITYQALLLSKGSILIIDPLGHAIMHYKPNANPNGILKDMRRLLKYSHVG